MSTHIIVRDCLEALRKLPDESVHCVVTSPPYWGLRDYGTATWEGGDPGCDHRSPTMRDGRNEDRAMLAESAATNSAQLLLAARSACGKCGARRIDSQLGLEPSFHDYIAAMVKVFREVRRVLRKDGTLWLNMGDCYAVGKIGRADGERNNVDGFTGGQKFKGEPFQQRSLAAGLKPKDLVGMPWRLAFALQADGWYLRSDIIWHKPNPMPESVTDRPTKAHEYVFLMSKSERYYYDAEAIKEDVTGNAHSRGNGLNPKRLLGVPGMMRSNPTFTVNELVSSRNKRTVWTIPTAPFPEAHFATFPPALVEPCILAGCPKGGLVLDPFGGAGTTALIAARLGREAILIELNPQYAAMAERRLQADNNSVHMY